MLALLLLVLSDADAALVSRLGSLYFYDPLTFDSGILQQGGVVRGGAGAGGGGLEVGAEAPFYRELSVRVAHQQLLRGPDEANGHRVSWRLRTPVIQSIRFGRLDTAQFYYVGAANLQAPDPMAPVHEAGGALVSARSALGPAISQHFQAAAAIRSREQAGEDGARVGAVLREALIVQLGRGRGRWTSSLSTVEAAWSHYGIVARMEGRLDVSALSPTAHFTHGTATWTIGLSPRLRVDYDPDGVDIGWGGFAAIQVSNVPRGE